MANKLTKKQKKFADEYIEEGNGTKAAIKAYDTTKQNTASSLASENLRKPNIIEYLEKNADKAAERIITLSNQEENLTVSLGASKDILDRAGFKPVDKKQTVNLNMNTEIKNSQESRDLVKEYEDKVANMLRQKKC